MFLSLCLGLALVCVEPTAPPTRPDVVYYQTETRMVDVRDYTEPTEVAALPEQSGGAPYPRSAPNDRGREGRRCTIGFA